MSEAATRVFVSYRRGDSPGHAGRIRDALVARFGDGNVFYDLATVQAGANFAEVIKDAIVESTVVLAIVGPRWRRIGKLRVLVGQDDWISTELNLAGTLRKPVLPVIVNGATSAFLSNLPETLSYLSSINALLVRDESWDADLRQLLDRAPTVRATYPQVQAGTGRHFGRRLLRTTLAVLVGSALLLTWVSRDRSESTSVIVDGPSAVDPPSDPASTPFASSSFVGSIAHPGEVRGVAFSLDGKWIGTAGGNSHTVMLWDARTGTIAKRFAADSVVSAVAFSPDGRRVVSDAAVFDIETGERLFRLGNGGYAVGVSPDGRFVANASGYAPSLGIRMFDLATGALLKQISDEYASALAFNHDGTLVAGASGYLEHGVNVWSVSDYSLVRRLAGPSGAVAFSADGQYVAGAGGGIVRIFRVRTGEALRDVPGHGVAFSPTDRVLATAGENRRLRLYDPANGDPLGTLDVYASTFAFSPDGERIVTAGPDGSLEVTALGSIRAPATRQ